MRLLFVGPPGVGKGTQAKRLAQGKGIPHISTGDILRNAIDQKTSVGVKAKECIESGNLVPDDVMIDIIQNRFQASDCRKGYILDGFPRTTAQAEALHALLTELSTPIQAVIQFDSSDEVVMERITGRRTCSNRACQAPFHIQFILPKKEGICDTCGAALLQRKDDQPGPVQKRLEKYHRETAQIIPFYEKMGLIRPVDGTKGADEVFAEIQGIVDTL